MIDYLFLIFDWYVNVYSWNAEHELIYESNSLLLNVVPDRIIIRECTLDIDKIKGSSFHHI